MKFGVIHVILLIIGEGFKSISSYNLINYVDRRIFPERCLVGGGWGF